MNDQYKTPGGTKSAGRQTPAGPVARNVQPIGDEQEAVQKSSRQEFSAGNEFDPVTALKANVQK
jgi:hypothetical protein